MSFRFSMAWSRLCPKAGGAQYKGIDFYHRVIDRCLELGIEPGLHAIIGTYLKPFKMKAAGLIGIVLLGLVITLKFSPNIMEIK